MKRNIDFILCLIVFLLLFGCKGPGNHCLLECQYGVPSDETEDCKCVCDSTHYGELCENEINPHKMHVDVHVDIKPTYSYDPPELDVIVYDHATDTLWIDGYSDSTSFCFLRLYIDDQTKIKEGSTYSIEGSNNVGTCWASFLDPNQKPSPYTPASTSSGTLTITHYQPGTRISGRFDFLAYNGISTAHLIGKFDD